MWSYITENHRHSLCPVDGVIMSCVSIHRGKAHMYTVLTEAVDGGPSLLNTVVDYVCGPSVVIPAFIALL